MTGAAPAPRKGAGRPTLPGPVAIRYRWGDGTRAPKESDAQLVGEEIRRLERKARGDSVQPAAVVAEAAKNKEGVLGVWFTWDNDKAAELQRLNEARQLMRSVCVIEDRTDEPRIVRAFHRIVEKDGTSGYRSLATICTRQEWIDKVVASALAELRSWIDRHSIYAELAGAVRVVRDVAEGGNAPSKQVENTDGESKPRSSGKRKLRKGRSR